MQYPGICIRMGTVQILDRLSFDLLTQWSLIIIFSLESLLPLQVEFENVHHPNNFPWEEFMQNLRLQKIM